MSVLGRNRLEAILGHANVSERLIMTPMLSRGQIGDASIDIRVGNDYEGEMAHKTGAHFPGLSQAAKTADTQYWTKRRTPI